MTQPRVPCFKLEMKMDLPGFSRQFITSGRLGFCLRVLEEGEVCAGDKIELVATGPEEITVWDFARLYFFDYDNLEKIRRLIRIPAVPPDWVRVFEEMKRIKKLVLLQMRSLSLRCNRTRIYYWAELRLFDLKTVTVLPEFYYRFLFGLSMRLVRTNHFRTFANKAIHTIPYHIRFNIA